MPRAETLPVLSRRAGLALAATLALTACAQSPDEIAAAPVSTATYSSMSCRQLQAEAVRLNNDVARLTGQQQKKATTDAVAMGVGMVLFWPALFALGAGSDVGPQLAQAKGQAEAIQAAARQKGC
jgi:hypothetical protein